MSLYQSRESADRHVGSSNQRIRNDGMERGYADKLDRPVSNGEFEESSMGQEVTLQNSA